ncbi:MAG TPA: methylated-DNA--[protein]-cysteine S-methyltransferase [Candidatus Limnocylindria bacterium]
MNDLERRLASPPARTSHFEDLAAGLRRRAERAGLLDVAYATADSPLGPLTVLVTPAGLVRIRYPDEPLEATLQDAADRISPRVLEAPERTDEVRRELDEYFEGRRRSFDLPLDWRLVRGFAGDVLRATARVPFGVVTTYRAMAEAAGSPRAYRAAGNALGSNPIPIVVPCHRVLHTGGGLGGYTGGVARKEYLLELEGSLPPRG